jgi:hypothetical protein
MRYIDEASTTLLVITIVMRHHAEVLTAGDGHQASTAP